MVSDPAETAAQRAADDNAGWIPPFEYDDALDGARKALEPIRDWSAKWSIELLRRDLGQAWKELAPLVFSSKELTRADN